MKHILYLILLPAAVIVLLGCKSCQDIARPFTMTIITTDKLGDKPSDKLPEDIISLCAVFPKGSCGDTCDYARPLLKRICGLWTAERSLITKVENGVAVKASNPKFMQRNISFNLDSMTLGDSFSQEYNDTSRTDSSVQAYITKLRGAVVFYYVKGSKDSMISGRKIYADMEILKKAIAAELCNNRGSHIVVCYNILPDTGKSKPVPPVEKPFADSAKLPDVVKDTARKAPDRTHRTDNTKHPDRNMVQRPDITPPARKAYQYDDTVYVRRNRLLSIHDAQKRVAVEGDIIVGTWQDGQLVQGTWYTRNWRQKEYVYIGVPGL